MIVGTLKSKSAPNANEAGVSAAILVYEVASEEIGIGSGKGKMPRYLPGRANHQLCANETSELPLARIEREAGAIYSVPEILSPMDVATYLSTPFGSKFHPE